MYAVSPFGERRADIRAAYIAAQTICSQSASEVPSVQFAEMVEKLSVYLKCDSDHSDESEADMDVLTAMKTKRV